MVLRINITAAFDVDTDNTDELEDISNEIVRGLDCLRGVGAARVDSASYEHDLSVDEFMREGSGLREFEFTIPAPTKRTMLFI